MRACMPRNPCGPHPGSTLTWACRRTSLRCTRLVPTPCSRDEPGRLNELRRLGWLDAALGRRHSRGDRDDRRVQAAQLDCTSADWRTGSPPGASCNAPKPQTPRRSSQLQDEQIIAFLLLLIGCHAACGNVQKQGCQQEPRSCQLHSQAWPGLARFSRTAQAACASGRVCRHNTQAAQTMPGWQRHTDWKAVAAGDIIGSGALYLPSLCQRG